MNMLTPAQCVAKYDFLTLSTLYSAFNAGLLPFYRLPSRKGVKGKYLVKESELLAWVESNRHEVGASVPPEPKVTRPTVEHLRL